MMLHFLRHGLAVERGTPGFHQDNERPLTEKGTEKTRRIAEGLLAAKVSFDVILTSPYLRAIQTAKIVTEVFQAHQKLAVAEELTPEGDPRELIKKLTRDHAGAQNILLVGHEPSLSQLISVLLTGDKELPLELKKGGFCSLRIDSLRQGRCAILELLLRPSQLIRLG